MLSMRNLETLVLRERQKRSSGSREELMDEELRKAARDTRKNIDRAFDAKFKGPSLRATLNGRV